MALCTNVPLTGLFFEELVLDDVSMLRRNVNGVKVHVPLVGVFGGPVDDDALRFLLYHAHPHTLITLIHLGCIERCPQPQKQVFFPIMLKFFGLTLFVLNAPMCLRWLEFGRDYVGSGLGIMRHLIRKKSIESVNIREVSGMVTRFRHHQLCWQNTDVLALLCRRLTVYGHNAFTSYR